MKVIVFGANGKVGRLVVAELLEKGHEVVAFVHGEYYFPDNTKLSVTKGDVYDTKSVANALQNVDAVISALGSWGTKSKNVLTQGMQSIIPAMQSSGVKRIVSLTGADCNAPGDTSSLIHNLSHALFSILAASILKDGENHLDQLIASELDWTVLRSPVMNHSGNADAYTLGNDRPRPWQTIHRHSVARAMVDLLESSTYSCQSPFISRK